MELNKYFGLLGRNLCLVSAMANLSREAEGHFVCVCAWEIAAINLVTYRIRFLDYVRFGKTLPASKIRIES